MKYKLKIIYSILLFLVGTSANAATVSVNYTYDNIGRLITTAYTNTPRLGSISYNYDPAGNLLASTVTGSVGTTNQPPAPTARAITTASGTAGTSKIAANDPNTGDTFTYAISTAPTNGTATVIATGLATYTPNVGYTGTDSFVVTVSDNGTPQKSGTVTINVTVVAPVVVDAIPPVITLTGGNLSVVQGTTFTDPGYVATDNPGASNITGSVIVTGGPVNTAAAVGAVFTLNYNVSDTAGNPAVQKTRTVTITAIPDTTAPVITLTGGNVTVAQGGTFTEPGYSATDNPGAVNVTASVVIAGGPVNTAAAPGTVFTLNYNVSDGAGNPAVQKTRTVTITAVPDTIAPVITMNGGNATVVQGQIYNDAGATALDNLDGNLTTSISVTNLVNWSVIGTYTVTYNVSDVAGNAAILVIRTVTVVADQPPVITMIGATPITLVQGAVYNDRGATAIDDVDGNVTANIASANLVNTAVVATYTVTYNVSDAAGNAAVQLVRTVNVIPVGGAANPGEAVQVPLTGSAASVDVHAVGQSISNFSATAVSGTPPAGVSVPLGVLSYTTTVPVGAISQTVNLSFSSALPANFVLYKVDHAGIYSIIPNGAGVDQWTQVDATTIALTLSDGGQFDLDGVINGIIIDPVAVGVPSAPVAVAAPASSVGGGGCTISRSTTFDPVMLALLLFALIGLARRRH